MPKKVIYTKDGKFWILPLKDVIYSELVVVEEYVDMLTTTAIDYIYQRIDQMLKERVEGDLYDYSRRMYIKDIGQTAYKVEVGGNNLDNFTDFVGTWAVSLMDEFVEGPGKKHRNFEMYTLSLYTHHESVKNRLFYALVEAYGLTYALAEAKDSNLEDKYALVDSIDDIIKESIIREYGLTYENFDDNIHRVDVVGYAEEVRKSFKPTKKGWLIEI